MDPVESRGKSNNLTSRYTYHMLLAAVVYKNMVVCMYAHLPFLLIASAFFIRLICTVAFGASISCYENRWSSHIIMAKF